MVAAEMAVTEDGLGLVEAAAHRVCHDLSGLVGTLIGTLELAEEEPDGAEALAVAGEAARTLGGRLRLLRTAWGGTAGRLDPPEIAELLSHAAGYPRTRTDWSAVGRAQFSEPVSRLLLNLALVAAGSLPRGGVVRVSGAADGTLHIALEGLNGRWPAPWVDAVARGKPPAVDDSRDVGLMLAWRFAEADGIGLSWEHGGVDQPAVLVVRP